MSLARLTITRRMLSVCAAGSDSTEQGFDCMLEYLYTSHVQGATDGVVVMDKVHATLQAAGFFGLPKLAEAVRHWIKTLGISYLLEQGQGS